ncbi:hypothetical protein M422DRAFT_51524 [Sphaerobolus stellatus SS14]|uniref:Uncharacterized protein n=1 Tax=Sphaerobolus stellatus (strain SS14) TaxID=990650 RepID=A0A0C9VDI7_SPHS4|nr:hypothetical protein M422DRAFT_51524 [Sphaerobolus stellatus SS14]
MVACTGIVSIGSSIQRTIEAFSEDGSVGAAKPMQTVTSSLRMSTTPSITTSSTSTSPSTCPALTEVSVSFDSNGSMTTDSVSSALFQRIAEEAGHTIQLFQICNDSRGGGTISPMLSAAMGVRAIDTG